jgi:hypothetical protein
MSRASRLGVIFGANASLQAEANGEFLAPCRLDASGRQSFHSRGRPLFASMRAPGEFSRGSRAAPLVASRRRQRSAAAAPSE